METDLSLVRTPDLIAELMARSDCLVLGMLMVRSEAVDRVVVCATGHALMGRGLCEKVKERIQELEAGDEEEDDEEEWQSPG